MGKWTPSKVARVSRNLYLESARSNANECDILGSVLNLLLADRLSPKKLGTKAGHIIGSDIANQAYDIVQIMKRKCGCR